ncbi:hypothetical protein, conserved [Babesia ovata]|uniref:Extracellular matrix-binding ebh n=1 Tax=Babesia ovata TaxID=189622 RepID=A0A2H6KK50_9APIC|nr:uncharacterized protein BOVATA_048660 [Babesia ovata]GBE63373.1 hypothetical protein, conserved [Babesia ovata]
MRHPTPTTPNSPPSILSFTSPTSTESPAQAVDSALGKVKSFVEGSGAGQNGDNITSRFKKDVIGDLTREVEKLPDAVEHFEDQAKQQIRAAATTAITKAADIVADGSNVDASAIDLSTKMPTFNSHFTAITKNLDSELSKQVEEHIGQDDGQPGGKITELKTTMFNNYNNHVEQESVKTFDPNNPDSLDGQLPVAISSISSDGLKDLTELIDDSPSGGTDPKKITKQTFEAPVTAINKQLGEIKKLVAGEDGQDAWSTNDNKGIKIYLGYLKDGLNSEEWKPVGIPVQGLAKIAQNIRHLQNVNLTNKPIDIDYAVRAIKGEVKELREKLKKDNDNTGVINVLTDLKDSGLSKFFNAWPADSKTLNGLGRIYEDLKRENDKLPKQTKIIDDTINIVKQQINDALRDVGFKLHHDLVDDDVVDQLVKLAKMIGKSKDGYHNNLVKICEEINWQQISAFTYKPQAIHQANEAIKVALKAQMSTLDNDVITTLNDLMTNGLSNQASWKPSGQEAAKGFDHIISELNTQQSTLEQQPTAIGSGVTQITNEIDELRSELQGKDDTEPKEKGVINNLKHLEEKIGEGKNEGLEKIKKDIEELNRDTVPKVNEHLGELCAKIASEAGSVDWQLGLFKKNNIDKDLAKIKTQIDTLRTGDLQAAIAMCDKFLTDADYIKWEKVENIERFVDSEIEKAIAELSKQARRQYVESAKDALKHFADKVAGELGELPKDIAHDLAIGFKGFMAKLENGFVKNIEGIKGIDFRDFKNRSPLSQVAEKISASVHGFFPELMQQEEFLNGKFPKPAKSDTSQSLTDEQVEALESMPENMLQFVSFIDAFDNLIQHIEAAGHFDFPLTVPLEKLKKQLGAFTYDAYNDGQRALLRPLKNGINNIHVELGNAYISTYSGQEFTAALVEPESAGKNAAQSTDLISWQNSKLTPYGGKLSKVFLTLLPILETSFAVLKHNCKSLAGQHLNRSTDLGRLLGEMGYRVPDDGKQDGELNSHVTGRGITMLLVGDFERVFNSDKDTKNALGVLVESLNDYYKACHYATLSATRTPRSVYEMLCWLTGLPHNCVYDKLCKFTKLCYDEQTENSLYPTTITADALVSAIDRLTAHCPSILTRVLGYGDAYSTYACDFYNNSTKLYYPQDGEECLHLLLHILCRLLSVLRYLFSQCSLPAHHGGWADCKYGKGATPYTWQCNPPLNGLPNPHPECSDKSPLMSYLNDCLPGLLPHQVIAIGCEPKCNTCPTSQPGMPCLTPLGFRTFSGSTKTGKHLCAVLTKLLANVHIKSLLSLCPTPPATLAEHFGFAFSLVREWRDASQNSFQECFRTSITDVSMGLYTNTNDLTNALSNAYGSSLSNHSHTSGDPKPAQLSSLSMDPACLGDAAHCAPYLSTLCFDPYHYLAHRHSDLYLSWAVYLPWNFYDLLLCLYTAFCNISCRDWGCGDCLHEDPCDRGSHGVLSPQSPASGCRCRSTVHCRGVMPTLYQHSLTFKDAPALISQNKNCSTLAKQLSQVLHSDHFTELFDQCDQFLYRIRMPFLCAIIALWLLATLYILSALLYRLDLLRIHSHLLTTRASHLIDVKALLAGSRRMLSLYKDVDYFDDDFHS